MRINTQYFIYIAAILFFALGFFSGWQIKDINSKDIIKKIALGASNNNNQMDEIRLAKSYKFINPLLECEGETENLIPIKKLQESVSDYINQQTSPDKLGHINSASVYFRDLNNGPWFGIGQSKLFSPASLLKVPLMMVYYKLAEDNPKILDSKIKNTIADSDEIYKDVSFKPTQRLETGAQYTVKELIDHMIIYSDNVAYQLLFANIDDQTKQEIYGDLGVDISMAQVDPTGDIVSVKDYSAFFRILYNASYLTPTYSEKALDLLSRAEFKEGIIGGLPKGIVVAHKFGERYYGDMDEKQLSECGIVYLGRNPYLLCVVARGVDFSKLTETLSTISSITYSFLSSYNWGK